MSSFLVVPSADAVSEAGRRFNEDPWTPIGEEALKHLWREFPQNIDPAKVLLKVIVLNQLYSTQIPNIHVRGLARHIAGLNIDPLLATGAHDAVRQIASCPDVHFNYSFATKFCHWHNPEAFPIYDRNVDEALWAYKRQDEFAVFHRQDMWDYELFCGVITAFRNRYDLGSISLKELDQFLWLLGSKLLAGSSAEPQ